MTLLPCQVLNSATSRSRTRIARSNTIEKQGAQLGAERTIIRRGVEAAFDQFEKFQQPTDYGPDLGRIGQQLALVAEHLEAVEQSTILRQGPEHYARALERSGDSLVRTAAQQPREGRGSRCVAARYVSRDKFLDAKLTTILTLVRI